MQKSEIKALDGRIHYQNLLPLSADEVEEYLGVCHPESAALPEKKKQQLILLSEGLPGRIEALLNGQKVEGGKHESSVTAFPLPAMHMVGIGFLLAAILAISLWQFFPSDENVVEVKEVSGDTMSLPLPVPALNPVEEKPAEINITEQVVSDKPHDGPSEIKQALQERLAQQELKLQQEKQDAPIVAERNGVEVAQLAEELKEVVRSESAPQSKPQTQQNEVIKEGQPAVLEPVVEVASPSKAKAEKKSLPLRAESAPESDILKWNKSGYTLQMLGARSKQSAMEFVQAQKNPKDFYYFSTIYKGAPWHVVIYGQYANRDVANAAIKNLPLELQKIKPWARSVQGVQLDIKKK